MKHGNWHDDEVSHLELFRNPRRKLDISKLHIRVSERLMPQNLLESISLWTMETTRSFLKVLGLCWLPIILILSLVIRQNPKADI